MADENDYINCENIILDYLEKIKKTNSRIFVILNKKNNTKYIKNDKIIYLAHNEINEILEALSLSLELKIKKDKQYIKYKKFIIFYCAVNYINKKYNLKNLIYINRYFKLADTWSEEFFKLFNDEKILIYFFGRSRINYIDDMNFVVFNTKHNYFEIYIKYILNGLFKKEFINEYELDIEYLFTKIRYKFQNLHEAKNCDLSNFYIKNKSNVNIYNLITNSIIGKYLIIDEKFYEKYNLIKNNKFFLLKNKKHNMNRIFSNLDLEGLFTSKEKILNIYDFKNNIEEIFKNNKFFNLKLHQFLKNLKKINLNSFDTVYIDSNNFIKNDKFFEFLHSLSNSNKKIIIKITYYVKIENQLSYTLISNINDFLFEKFSFYRKIKNVRSDILIAKW